MQKIVRGIHLFQTTRFSEHQALFEKLSMGQEPETLLITCSDSRIVPDLLTQTQPGELFVIRNAGNIIPPYGAANGGEGATIEFAIGALNVQHIIVMGHSHCGAMKGLLEPQSLTGLPLVSQWLMHAEATRAVVQESYRDLSDKDLLNATIKENVLVQVDNLRTYPCIAARMARGNLTLHAWIYEIESGRILAFDREEMHFVPVDADVVKPIATRRLTAEPKTVKTMAAAVGD